MSQVTKRALEQSLKNLLLKKPLTKITINDIAEDCGINSMTYNDPDPQVLADNIIYAINQPWGVSIGDLTVRASGESFVI